jgi:hypothetical protein
LLPAWEADLADDLVDVCDDALDDHWRLRVLDLAEQLGQRSLPLVLHDFCRLFLLGLDDIPCQLE